MIRSGERILMLFVNNKYRNWWMIRSGRRLMLGFFVIQELVEWWGKLMHDHEILN
jgi:hypothetical protein